MLLEAGDGLALLSHDPQLRTNVARLATSHALHSTSDAFYLISMAIALRVRVALLDLACDGTVDALRRLAALPARSRLLVVLIAREPPAQVPAGADLVVLEPALGELLGAVLGGALRRDRPPEVLRLSGVSLLGGALDQTLEIAADQLAAAFGVERCVISLREDSAAGATSGTGTWSSLEWGYTVERCRAAAAAGTPLVAAVPDPRVRCQTYLGVRLDTRLGQGGVLGLVATGPFVFDAARRPLLGALADRLATEVGWLAAHERATEELDRLVSSPGHDATLGIWNGAALKELTAMKLSAAARTGFPLSVAVLDVVGLQAINNRFGLAAGDRLLRRIADAVRATMREEDIVGRWGGDEIGIVLHGVARDACPRVAERLLAALDDRPLELPGGELLPIRVTIGLATAEARDGALPLFGRAARAAHAARQTDARFARAQGTAQPGLRVSQEMEVVTEEIATTLGTTYRLLHEISRGGMGVVYRATDRALERPVAIKVLRPDLAEDPQLVERFRVEAAMLAHIQHPNLVQIYNYGQSGGDAYFVMELVEGESLEQAFARYRVERSSMALADVCSVVEQIASALDALHDRGFVHRDVKPANVIRDPFRDRCVLVDVGIARRYGQDSETSGTPGFIAPEVLSNEPATPRSDVYGLAATAYTMLTLHRPFGEGDPLAVFTRQCAGELRPASALRPELAPLDELFARALASGPQARPASAGQFARELVAGLTGVLPALAASAPAKPAELAPDPAAVRATKPDLPRTRGVVFRSLPRAIGVRESERLRDLLGDDQSELASALAQTAPLAWLPTDLMSRLLAVAPQHLARDRGSFARDVARAAVRMSFRRFFPASSATLVPERTLSAIRNIWGRYHSWGNIAAMPVRAGEVVVRLTGTPGDDAICAWTAGLLEQLVVLSGGKGPTVAHDECEAAGAAACLFRVCWQTAEP